MRTASRVFSVISCLLAVFAYGYALAGEPDPGASKTLAVVTVHNGRVDQKVYRKFDRLVPELKRISGTRIVKLECRYPGRPGRERDVQKAYELAAQVEKYLRVRHKLDIDLWISVSVAKKPAKSSHVLTMAVFSGDVTKSASVLID